MSEKVTYGQPRDAAIIRTPVLTFTLIRWDWKAGKRKDRDGIDITNLVYRSQWQKTIKSPIANGAITMIPQYKGYHALDFISVMDVIEIREFGRLVFQGYIWKIGATGQITPTGTPSRYVTLSLSSMGRLLVEGQLGLNMFIIAGSYMDIASKMKQFAGKLADVLLEDREYAEILKVIIDEWFTFLESNGASSYQRYLTEWIDFTTGLSGKTVSPVPRDLQLFYASDQQMTLWETLLKVVESPFNELWCDNGQRTIWYEQNKNLTPTKPGSTTLSDEKTYLILRQTPFNGTMLNGVEKNLWDSLPIKQIPMNYYTRWDLNKSAEEVYSVYMVAPATFNPGELELLARGVYEVDEDALNKYLYRPLNNTLFFDRMAEHDDVKLEKNAQTQLNKYVEDKAQTLKNWFKLNDQYLSGSISMNVAQNDKYNPYIGERIQLEGMGNTSFYVEGVAHTWNYQQPLIANISVTRGYGLQKPIELKDKIFKRGKFVINEGWT